MKSKGWRAGGRKTTASTFGPNMNRSSNGRSKKKINWCSGCASTNRLVTSYVYQPNPSILSRSKKRVLTAMRKEIKIEEYNWFAFLDRWLSKDRDHNTQLYHQEAETLFQRYFALMSPNHHPVDQLDRNFR